MEWESGSAWLFLFHIIHHRVILPQGSHWCVTLGGLLKQGQQANCKRFLFIEWWIPAVIDMIPINFSEKIDSSCPCKNAKMAGSEEVVP